MSSSQQGVVVHEPNLLYITCTEFNVEPTMNVKQSRMGLRLKITSYDVEQVLCCLLEEYGEETLLKKIKEL